MNLLFFQVLVDTTHKVGEAVPAEKTMHMLDLIENGGPLMIPLGILLLLALYFFFERAIALKKASKVDGNFMNMIRDHIVNGNVTAARTLAKNSDNAVARVIDKGIQRIGKPIDAIEKSMENVGKLEMYKMEKNVSILSMISGMAPLFGFLGTIIGMIQMFSKIQSSGQFDLNTIAGGIYVKMITSATGLIIGLLAYMGYNFLNTQIDKIANRMEVASGDFLDVLQEPIKK